MVHGDNQQETENALSLDIAYLLGVYMSDGHCRQGKSGAYVYTQRSIDRNFLEYVQDCFGREYGKRGKIYLHENGGFSLKKGNRKTIFKLEISSKEHFNRMIGWTNKKEIVPESVRHGKRSVKENFLAGLMDGDGWISLGLARNGNNIYFQVGLASISPWIDDVARLFHSIDIRTTTIKKMSGKENRRFFVNVVDFIRSGIRFRIGRKQNRLELIARLLRDFYLGYKPTSERNGETRRLVGEWLDDKVQPM